MHIGGWKKLYDQKVSKEEFNKTLVDVFGVKNENILDVYGFTEQLGTVYISQGDGMKRKFQQSLKSLFEILTH